ncbi:MULTISPECIES: hypothetical protein [Kocuria]|uniref:Uncharacterized protein n=1 Tax=Kocuria rosea subsp. polaris TaxID=136273 RepID=A0A0W8I4F5_KOCRO|nr:hypothetical protein [Kocuria polaris]KUG52934.1 hypothetical protein AVL61_11970 [Kocuria polaris]
MLPLMPAEALDSPPPFGLVLGILGLAVAAVCVAALLRLYRPKHLDQRTGTDGGTAAGGSTAGFWGYGGGDSGRGFDGGGGVGGGEC